MGGPSQGGVVVGELPRVDFGSAIDQQSRRFDGASSGGPVQRSGLLAILDLDGHTGIEEKRDDVGSIALDSGSHRFRAGPFFGMRLEVSPDGIAIPGEARADEAFVVVQHRDTAGRAVAHEQVGDLGDAFLLGDLVGRALREARIPRRSGVRIRAARQRPFGERKIAFLDRRLEDKTRTGAVAAHIEHRPVGIVPRNTALGLRWCARERASSHQRMSPLKCVS